MPSFGAQRAYSAHGTGAKHLQGIRTGWSGLILSMLRHSKIRRVSCKSDIKTFVSMI